MRNDEYTHPIRTTLPYFAAALILCLGLTLAPLSAQVEMERTAGWLAMETARSYETQARYPASSYALAPGLADPVRADLTASRLTVRHPERPEAVLSVWADRVSFVDPAPVKFYTSLEGASALAVTAEAVRQDGSIVGQILFHDDGVAPDRKAGDGILSGRLELTKAHKPDLAESYLLKVQASLEDGTTLHATSGFLYSRPTAFLTGRYRDRLVDGNVVIKAEVEVTAAGRYHLRGTLHTLKGEAIGVAQAAAELEPGRHWLKLSFFGLMFHERQVAGPFRLGSVALATTTFMPNALNPVVENVHRTRAYPLERLRSTPFGDPQLLNAAARLRGGPAPGTAQLEE